MKNYNDGFYKADEGKHFVVSQKGIENCASFRTMKVGDTFEDNVIPKWAIDEGMATEEDIEGWTTGLKGFKVGYYYKGHFLSCGNPITFPTKAIAETYAKNYSAYPWFKEEIVIEETLYDGIPFTEARKYNGKEVVDEKHYFGLMAHNVGDYFDSTIVDWFRDCVPPTYNSNALVQCGEPKSQRTDENGCSRTTFDTFKRVASDIWEYCGDCFKGEDHIHGKEEFSL